MGLGIGHLLQGGGGGYKTGGGMWSFTPSKEGGGEF